ncbi:MAG: hypothetical protein ACO3JL_20505, partial [Myxococcota bacterium]
ESRDAERPTRDFQDTGHAGYLAAAKALRHDDPDRFAPVERDLQSLRGVAKLEDPAAVERELEKTRARFEGADDVTQKQLYARCLALALLQEERTVPSHRPETSETSLPFASAELRSSLTRSAAPVSPASMDTLRREPAIAHDGATRLRKGETRPLLEPETYPLHEPPTDPDPRGRETSSLSLEGPTIHCRSAIEGFPVRPSLDEGPTAPDVISLSSVSGISDSRATSAYP